MNHKFYYSFRILACLVFVACAITSGINMSEKGTSTIVTVLSVILIFVLLLTGGWITECSVRYLIYPWVKNISHKWNDRGTKQKPTVLPPIFKEIAEYTRTTFQQVLTPEEIDNLVNSMKFFAIDYEPDQHPAAVNRAIHRISTLDLHHFGWNIGKRLKKDNTGIAHFLKTQFPVVFKNSTEASMKKKLKSEDGRFMIDIIELDKELSPVNLNKNGFIDRFIFVKSEDNKIPLWSKTVPTKEDSYNPEAIWKEIIDRLMTLQPETDGVSGECHSVIVKLSGAAAERFVDWHNEFAQLQNEIEDERLLNTRTAKWDYQVPRMALVIHLLSWACYESDGEIVSLEAMVAAIKLNTFYETCYSNLGPYLYQSALPTAKAEYLKALPDEFKTHEAISIGKEFGISESTVKHDLPKFVKSGHLTCLSKGNYKKNYN